MASAARRWSQKNFAAVDDALAHLEKVELPAAASSSFDLIPSISTARRRSLCATCWARLPRDKGDLLPVSAIPAGGAFPTGTAQWEKRNIAQFIPVWDKDLCIQCGKCVMVCPHAVIRAKVYSAEAAANAPATFQWAKPKWKGMEAGALHAAGCSGRLHRLRASAWKFAR